MNSNKYSVSPVYDKHNQIYSILKNNDIKFEFIGDNPWVKHVCLPILPNMKKPDAIKVVEACIYK